MENTKTSEYHYNRLYSVASCPDLKLRLSFHGKDALEFELVNLRYGEQRLGKVKSLTLLVCLFAAYRATQQLQSVQMQSALWDTGFFLVLSYILLSTFSLVKSEKLLFCADFALQLQTTRFCSRQTNVFIPAPSIHDVVINEVIEDLDVHYMLIVRTKGVMFKQRPIIPIFNVLRPPLECLEVIYKHLSQGVSTE